MVRKSRVQFESEVDRLLALAGAIGPKIQTFAVKLSEFLEDSSVSVFFYEQEAEQFYLIGTSLKLCPDSGTFRFAAAGTISSLAILEGRPLSLQEVNRPRESAAEAGYHVFPLRKDDSTLGVVTIQHVGERGLGPVQLDVARRTIHKLSGIIGEAKKESDLSQRMTRIAAINEVGVSLVSHQKLEDLLKTATAVTALIMGAGVCIIRTYDEASGSYVPGDCYGVVDKDLRRKVLDLDRRAAEKVLADGRPLLMRSLSGEEFREFADLVRTFICHPLKSGKDVIGSLSVFNKNTGNAFAAPYFTEEDLGNLTRLSKYVEQAITGIVANSRTKELQDRDETTGLPDMKYFKDRLRAEISRAERFEGKMVLLTCETSLRQHGESLPSRSRFQKMIRGVAQAIRQALREYDVVASTGEGRFSMILPQAEDGTMSAAVRVKVAVDLAVREFRNEMPDLSPEISFQKVLYPEDGEDAETLLSAMNTR
jgi:GGDEF domain-containing protein